MNIVKKIIVVLIGTFIIGLGIAFTTYSKLGQDCLAALVFSIHYLIDLPFFTYSVCYFIINGIFCILVLIFSKDKIHIGSILNFTLTGICVDLCIYLFSLIKMDTDIFVLRALYSFIGISLISLGIALYGSVNLGLAPYDALPFIINKVFKKIKYSIGRMIVALVCIIVAFVIGVLILNRSDIININTLLASVLLSVEIPIFSKMIHKNIIKTDINIFN